jgi:hypothetical protein
MIARIDDPAAAAPPAIPVIHPRSVMTLDQAGELLALPPSCLPREARLGRLRTSRRAGRLWVTGAWLLAWIEGGETSRRRRRERTAN